jgi:hypothetical protein
MRVAQYQCKLLSVPETALKIGDLLALGQSVPSRILRTLLSKLTPQISDGKQGETENSAPEIEEMTNASGLSPLHPKKQLKRFGNVCQNNHYQTACTKYL